jgi:glycosyltransferase involved in cell wall biosynthesis
MIQTADQTIPGSAPASGTPRTTPALLGQPVLSVVIPVYNEAATIVALLDKVFATSISKQVIVVDDGSSDQTVALIEDWRARNTANEIELLAHAVNRGKGAAIRTGIAAVRGAVTIVQDADLEYDPADYDALVAPIMAGEAEVVFGSRYTNRENYLPWTPNRICVHLLNFMVWLLYGQRTSDEATCYKVLRSTILPRLDLQCQRFEFCPELTAKVCRLGLKIHELPIRFHRRTHQEGKKIGWRDGVQAIHSLIYWRFARFCPPDADPVKCRITTSSLEQEPVRSDVR